MHVTSFDHIVICVDSVDRCLAFYRDVLGMEPREERPGKWSLHFGSSKISVQAAATVPAIAKGTLPGSANFCLLTDVDMSRVVARLGETGVEVEDGPVEREGATGKLLSVYFRDPDGNLVEVSNLQAGSGA